LKKEAASEGIKEIYEKPINQDDLEQLIF